jgi:2',3'-cyclic-nucleotide 2'-phosphodiesterase/3'-nucleotidase/5'-nucleotidase
MILNALQIMALCTGGGDLLELLGVHESGRFNQSASEYAAYVPEEKTLMVVNVATGLDRIDISDPENPKSLGTFKTKGANSVAVHGNLVALVSQGKGPRGTLQFLNHVGEALATHEIDHGPDMCLFTEDGRYLVVACEGEPSHKGSLDPRGSVAIIDLENGPRDVRIRHAGFERFDDLEAELKGRGVHLSTPKARPSQDIEPEFIAIDPDGTTAWVALQENNAIARVDIVNAVVTGIQPLGLKTLQLTRQNGGEVPPGADRALIDPWPLFAMYQPDGIVTWKHQGRTFIASANEGEPRQYAWYDEAVPITEIDRADGSGLPLDPRRFPTRSSDEETTSRTESLREMGFGASWFSRAIGDDDEDGDWDRLITFGTGSVSIWEVKDKQQLTQVWDSGDQFEHLISARSVPEGLALGTVDGTRLLFVGLERPGGVVTIDVTDPDQPWILGYDSRRNHTVDLTVDNDLDGTPDGLSEAGDLGPEGLLFIDGAASPNGRPLLVVCNEVSGTTTIYALSPKVLRQRLEEHRRPSETKH